VDLGALINCLGAPSCVITQATSGLIIGMLLFLVAAGLTLIFGVLKIVNFAHGSFYMLGAYFALTIFKVTGGSYLLTLIGAAAATAAVGLAFERLLISRVYGQNVLMQLLVCYGFVLILDDLVKIVWGAEFRSMGMPQVFQVPPFIVAGGVIPAFYLFLVGVTIVIALALWLGIGHTRIGRKVTAAAQNPAMVSALGIDTGLLYTLVFALGGMLAGLAGALAAPVRSATPGMGFSILIESFIVTVIGGMGSIAGALVGSLMIGMIRTFGSLGFPLFTDGLMYLFMVLVLVIKPTGLFGRETA
jgi:branched-chain amino acid transport system permease protein